MSFGVKFVVALTLLVSHVLTWPANNDFLFREDDDSGRLVTLEEEGQILPSDQPKLIPDASEAIDQHLEHGSLFQGDIHLVQDQKEYYLAPKGTPVRTGWIDESYRWPKDKLGRAILTYYLSPKSQFSTYQTKLMRQAMNDIEHYTCIRFKERTVEEDYVYIYSGSGCSSHLGKIGGQQELSLQKNGCFSKGIIIHEIIHALGYDHMHSHSERNQFVDIVWANIQSDAISNFDEVDAEKFSNFGTKYDLYSVMHYGKTAFSKNGESTIVPKNRRYKNIIGQRTGLSIGDVQRINNMYKCEV